MGNSLAGVCRVLQKRNMENEAGRHQAGTLNRGQQAGGDAPAEGGGHRWERSPLGGKTRLGAWLRWIAFMEGLILLLAIAGPGRRRRPSRQEEAHGMFARWFMDDPNWLEATAVNFVLLNGLVFFFLFLAWGVTKLRRRGRKV